MSPASGSALQRLVLVTGPSGAGRSTAIKALEDAGYETIDNLPFGLLERLFSGPVLERPMALGLDVRNRDFSQIALIEALDLLAETDGVAPELLYLDCQPDVLQRRYSETRRRHPLAPGESPLEGISQEIDLLKPIRARADVLIDTSELSPHALRAEIDRWFASKTGPRLGLTVQSFSYKRGLPTGVDLVFDCRFLRNPYWEPSLRTKNGLDDGVAAYVEADERFAAFFSKLTDMVDMLLPAYLAEGRSHVSIGFGCTGGQHRSVFTAERLAAALAQQGWQVSIRHRELDRRAALASEDRSGGNAKDGQA
ncbi:MULTISPECIES: RNase adapter RapZ [Shimia]|uniref:RNase adapter RapZ n=1 Tax=Shimia TaxID=573139 RepID=UPI001FB3D534|nr:MULTISPECIES: RNase adapter RapZ [Shimia]MDV4146585.1 RNase adapter RapZ [Shimia sp. FJ5]